MTAALDSTKLAGMSKSTNVNCSPNYYFIRANGGTRAGLLRIDEDQDATHEVSLLSCLGATARDCLDEVNNRPKRVTIYEGGFTYGQAGPVGPCGCPRSTQLPSSPTAKRFNPIGELNLAFARRKSNASLRTRSAVPLTISILSRREIAAVLRADRHGTI